MIEAVLSYHMNPLACGTAKWNQRLARELRVPCYRLGSREAARCTDVLVSIKPDEMPGDVAFVLPHQVFDLILHAVPHARTVYVASLRLARTIYAANHDIAAAIRPYRTDAQLLACPPSIAGDPSRGAYRVLVFGMAHKRVLPEFVTLKAQLDRDHPDYTVSVSVGVHEGSPWEQTLLDTEQDLRAIFGDKLRMLGFLLDDALAKELQECDAVACFYQPAFRSNNTTAWAALAAGKTLYTNRDADSPVETVVPTWPALVSHLAGDPITCDSSV